MNQQQDKTCPHKQLKKQLSGNQSWYVCLACPQKFKVELWDGKVEVRKEQGQ